MSINTSQIMNTLMKNDWIGYELKQLPVALSNYAERKYIYSFKIKDKQANILLCNVTCGKESIEEITVNIGNIYIEGDAVPRERVIVFLKRSINEDIPVLVEKNQIVVNIIALNEKTEKQIRLLKDISKELVYVPLLPKLKRIDITSVIEALELFINKELYYRLRSMSLEERKEVQLILSKFLIF